MFKKPAICVDATPEGYVLLTSGDKTVDVPTAELTELEPSDLTFPGRQATCSASLLFNAFIAASEGSIKVKWDPPAVWTHAFRYLNAHPDEVRAVAVDAAANGFVELIRALALAPLTQKWLLANALFRAGQRAGCVEQLLTLPAAGYPDKVALLAACWREARTLPGAAERLRMHLEPFRDRLPATIPLLANLATNTTSLEDLHQSIAVGTDVLTALESEQGVWLRNELVLLTGREAERSQFASTRALGYYRSVVSDSVTTPIERAEDLSRLATSMVDDLVDAGVISSDQVHAISLSDAHPSYLSARIDPARCSDEQLRSVGHDVEIGRRAFLAWDKRQLTEITNATVREHFLSLDALREGKVAELHPERFLPAFRPKVAMALAAMHERDVELAETRVLADKTLWPAFAACVNPIAFQASPGLLERASLFCEWMQLVRVRALLFAARWTDALEGATSFLATATDEQLRDEALNLAACAHYQLGDDAKAIKALQSAIEGQYGHGLLANIGIVAANLAPDIAAHHLGKLIVEAPTLALKLAAADRAIAIWRSNEATWIVPTESRLPESIAVPLRQLVVLALPLDRFREIVQLQSELDAAWLSTASLAQSVHADTIEARYFKARATSWEARVKVLAEATRTSLDTAWIVNERDGLAQMAIEFVVEDSDDALSRARFAGQLLDHDVVLTPWQRLALTATTTWRIADALRTSGDEIADRLRDRLLNARSLLAEIDIEARPNGSTLLNTALDSVARNVAVFRTGALGLLNHQFQEIVAVIRRTPTQQLNWAMIHNEIRRIRTGAREAESRVALVHPFLLNDEHRLTATGFLGDAQNLQRRCGELGG